MSGHSKWSTIKRKKAAVDAKRGKVFTRLLREVTIAARLGGGDAAANPRLRAAIQDSKSNNVPNDTVERAIKKGTGELEGQNYEEVSYEGYGPGGVAVMVQAMTDNRNRTVGEIRHLFSRYGGNLGENGCVSWMFDQRGYFQIDPTAFDEETFMELALEIGADDFAVEESGFEIYTAPGDYLTIKETLAEREVPVSVHELAMIPQNTIMLANDKLPSMLRLMEALEDQDDVQNVWANFDADEAALDAHAG